MKRPVIILPFILLLTLCSLVGCQETRIYYNGPSYIMFSDTLNVIPVTIDDEYSDITIVATRSYDYDRTVSVDVVERLTNAIEGKHYELESNKVTIKAGELVANVRVRGFYDEITVNDDFELTLQLVEDQSQVWDAYGDRTRVILYKVCPFDINAFTRYAIVQSSYLTYYTYESRRLIWTEIDPDNENTVILRNCFHDGFDMSIRFTVDDELNPLLEMDEQVFASTADAFGTLYGDGLIHVYQTPSYVSYYSSCENFIFQYMTLYVSNYPAAGYNTVVDTFYNIIRWISDDEAERWRLEGY